MLKTVNLSAALSRKEYLAEYDALSKKLVILQRELIDKKIPVFILTEGWHGSFKGIILNQFLLTLDPRGYRYASFFELAQAYTKIPLLIPFWQETPAAGQIGVLETDWYRGIYQCRYGHYKDTVDLTAFYRDVNAFERQLVQSGMIVLKFFFHVDRKTQKKRLSDRKRNESLSWTTNQDIWLEYEQYEDYCHAAEELIQNTQTPFSTWHIVSATNIEFAASKTLTIIASALESYLNNPPVFTHPIPYQETEILKSSFFSNIDYTKTISNKNYNRKLRALNIKLFNQVAEALNYNMPIIVVFEGVDAAGKGGGIRRITQALLPRNYNVVPISAPAEYEKQHHFMWRFWRHFPTRGHLTIFDRSWYGRVLVERVEGFATPEDWQRAYDEINDTELHLSTWGTVIVKFYVQISFEEQLARFERRKNTPEKSWKLTDEDWRNREKWVPYEEAASEMFARTSTTYAPWTLIATDCKKLTRIEILETLTDAIEKKLVQKRKDKKSQKSHKKNKDDKQQK